MTDQAKLTTTPKEKKRPPTKGQVNVRHYGSLVRPLDMRDWPNATEDGYDFGDMLAAEGVTSGRDDARFWQAAVRWALLKKYGYLTQPTRIHEASSSSLEDPFVVVENNQKKVRH